MTRGGILYLASFVAHGALAVGVVSLKAARAHDNVVISVVETKKQPKAEVEPPAPPPPPAETAKPEPDRKAKAATPKAAAAEPTPNEPAANDGPSTPDFGLSLGGGSSGGMAVAAPKAAAPTTSATAERVSKKVLAAPPPGADECTESPKKPKVLAITQPSYTAEAREAQVAGKVRVEVTVDATGKVASARVLEGLGHGLDDAALAAARSATFEAGTKCGKPTSATFVIAIRFAL